MGDPRKQRKKYSTPSHPWQKDRITHEKELILQYGLKNKKEIWKMGSMLKSFARQAKRIIASPLAQSEIEGKSLLKKAASLKLIEEGAGYPDLLGLDIRKILDRRLQTIVKNKGLSKTFRQARQFITHNHILVNNKIITSPSYLVTADEENSIVFTPMSQLASQDHPERQLSKKQEMEKKRQESSKEEKKEEPPKKVEKKNTNKKERKGK